jgi:hypothetical protein
MTKKLYALYDGPDDRQPTYYSCDDIFGQDRDPRLRLVEIGEASELRRGAWAVPYDRLVVEAALRALSDTPTPPPAARNKPRLS